MCVVVKNVTALAWWWISFMFNCVIVGHHHRPWIELIEGGPHTFTAFLLSFQRLAWDLFDAHDDSCLFAVCWMYVYLRWITSVDIGISRLMLPRANSCGTTFGVIWNWLYIAELIEWQVGIKDEPKTKRRRSHTNTFFLNTTKYLLYRKQLYFMPQIHGMKWITQRASID